MKKILIFSIAVLSYTGLFAQKDSMYPKYIEFGKDNAPAFQKEMLFASQSARVSNGTELKLLSETTDELGFTHYRFIQLLNGIPVEGTNVIQHVKNGKLVYQNGDLVKTFPVSTKNNIKPIVSENEALNFAKNFVGAKVYKWELQDEENFIKRESGNPNSTFLPKAEKVYYSPGSEFNASNLRLAYKLDVYAHAPLSRKIIYVDAIDGKILGSEDKIKEIFHGELKHDNVNKSSNTILANAVGTATTAYSGSQSMTTDYSGSTYRLRETGRGNGIETYNLQRGTSYSSAVDFTDADNNWNNVNTLEDQYATDAHWGAEKVYDFFKIKLNRNSLDNAGMKILSYVHFSTNYLNAYWDGSRMTYGDGNASTTPLTCLDIVAHEMTHGVTDRTSNLTYQSESGALNEAYSDILGIAVDFYAKPNSANWLLGEQIGLTFRSMSNPNAYSQPDTYKGTKWVNTVGCSPTDTNDYCGVHTNSGVLNFWFYLLVNGGTGTNDINNAYSVSGIGIDKAAAIAYRANTSYLGSSSTYADARTYSIKSAEDLYGVGSNEANQVMNAFYAVGIGSASGGTTPPPSGCSAAFEANETLATAAAISLNVDNSAAISSSTDVDYYKFTTTSTGDITVSSIGPSGVDYDMYVYNAAGTELGKGETSTASETVNLANQPAGTYYVKYIGYSGANSTTCYTIKATSITSTPTCNAPTGLTSSAISQNSATVSWTAVSGATGYSLEYKPSSATNYTVQTVTGTTATLSGLTAGTLYDWRVNTICSATSSSSYSTAQFTTTATTTCNAPTGLTSSAISQNSATVSWTAVSGATGYSLEYKPSSATTYTVQTVTGTTATISGLTAGTLYDWRVKTNCSATSSSIYNSAQFTTTSTPSGCSAAFEANETLATAAAISLNVDNSAAIDSPTDVDYYKFTTTSTGDITVASVGPSGVDYDMYVYNDAGTEIGKGETSSSSETVNLTNQPAGTYYVKYVGYSGANSTTCYTIKATGTTSAPTCDAPTGLTSSAISQNSATVSWNTVSGATGYSLEYKPSSATTYTVQTVTGTTATLSGLTAGTLYDWRVNTICSTTSSSTYNSAQFTTTSATSGCSAAFEANETLATAAAISLNVDNSAAIDSSTDVDYYKFTTTSTGDITVASVGPIGVDYDMYVYNAAGTEIGYSETSSSSETVNLTNQPAGTYYVEIIGYNGENSATCYTIKATSITSTATCDAPTGLTSSAISQNSAIVSWTAVSGATGYSLEYKPSYATTYTVQTVTGTTAYLSGLIAGTLYDWRVKTNCSATLSSSYSTSQFTTTAISTGCNNAFEPNNSRSSAKAITALNKDYNAAIETTTDNDYYKVTFSSGGNFTIKLSELTHDVDLKLYSSYGTLLKSSTHSGTSSEKIQYAGTASTYYIRVYPYSGSSPNRCYNLRVEPGLTFTGFAAGSDNEIINEEYKIYPNPVSDVLNIVSPEKFMNNSLIEVYDLSGNLKMTQKITTSNEKIRVNNLPSGVYILKVDNGDGEPIVSKFIKK